MRPRLRIPRRLAAIALAGSALAIVLVIVTAVSRDAARSRQPSADAEPGPYPSDWFGMQRAFPLERIPQEAFRRAAAQALAERTAAALSTSGITQPVWTQAGPYNIGGRVTALDALPGGVTVYLASANGGVFKSVNSGVNWTPISDDMPFFSIGALTIDPNDTDLVYVGTGEANASVDSYDGNGVWRWNDAGASWTHLGLEETARIGTIAVDPQNSNRIYVAAMGQQFSTDSNRGLYRSENGGQSWSQVLFVNDSTGVADVVVHPTHPETVYVATWERIRRPTYRRAFGPGCGIWRSADHGATWTRLETGLPAPSDNVGRIGLAIARSRPSTIYAQIVTGASGGYNGLGMYRSEDGGETWTRRDVSGYTGIFGGFAWYFGAIGVNPFLSDQVWAMGVTLARSADGGVTFANWTGTAHVDQHAIWFDPLDPSRIYLGNDGGFYWSVNGGSTWNKSVDLPITQFYAGAIDPSNPDRLLGGTQDNFTLITAGSPSAWSAILGGDGFYCLVDPTNPNVILAEFQFCCNNSGPRRSTNGGASFSPPGGIVGSDRFNWSTPFVMDPNDHNVILLGSHRVYRSLNNGVTYGVISGDLTTNPPALLLYGTITTLDISPLSPRIYYAGTDDGRVWRSTNAGTSWENISAGLPVRYVTRVTADPADSNVVYVTHSGFGLDEPLAHVHRSSNLGDTWVPIAGNLPDAPANDILVDPADPNTLYLGTDVGVFATRNLGAGWYPLGVGMPLQTIFDLTLHAPSRTLVAATHGRSQWKLDLNALPVAVAPAARPARLAFAAPQPNPSRGSAQLSLEVSSATALQIDIYDAMGRRVRALARGSFEPGRHTIEWDGTSDSGRRVEPGLYFVRASGDGAAATTRLTRVD
jgi:photosystem II stability/assembly factor-like uncharacterized protein